MAKTNEVFVRLLALFFIIFIGISESHAALLFDITPGKLEERTETVTVLRLDAFFIDHKEDLVRVVGVGKTEDGREENFDFNIEMDLTAPPYELKRAFFSAVRNEDEMRVGIGQMKDTTNIHYSLFD